MLATIKSITINEDDEATTIVELVLLTKDAMKMHVGPVDLGIIKDDAPAEDGFIESDLI